MHDKNGKPISKGDFVKVETYRNGASSIVVAEVLSLNPGSETCNITVGVPYTAPAVREEWHMASKVEKVDL